MLTNCFSGVACGNIDVNVYSIVGSRSYLLDQFPIGALPLADTHVRSDGRVARCPAPEQQCRRDPRTSVSPTGTRELTEAEAQRPWLGASTRVPSVHTANSRSRPLVEARRATGQTSPGVEAGADLMDDLGEVT